MADFVNVLAAVSIIVGAPVDIPDAELIPRFETNCTKGQWAEECPALRNSLEVQLYGDMYQLHQAGMPIDRTALRVAARAHFPYLAEFALKRIGRPQGPEDKEVVLTALDHPWGAVRLQAKIILDRSGDAWREGIGKWWQGNAGMTPNSQPDMDAYGLPGLNDPQFRYRYFASGAQRAVYTTKLPPEKVLDLIAKGKPVITGTMLVAAEAADKRQRARADEMAKETSTEVTNIQEIQSLQKQMMEAMQRGDVKTVQEMGKRMQQLMKPLQQRAEQQRQQQQADAPELRLIQDTAGMKPVTEFSVDISQVRYVTLDVGPRHARFSVAVAYDDAFGETAIVITMPN